MASLFTPTGFLTYGGVVLLLLGLVGLFALNDAKATPAFWLDTARNTPTSGSA